MDTEVLKNSRILIVDDKEANIDVLEMLLSLEGYIYVKSVTDSRKVAGIFHDFKPDILLLDLMMPHFSGFEVMEQVRRNNPAGDFIPILILTADASEETKKRALTEGANDFLSKPFDLTEVKLRVRNLLYTRQLYKQLAAQNDMLEKKVSERTRILELKNAELTLAREKAEAANRLKKAFLNNISHEIRTPLNGILGFGQLLADPSIPMDEKLHFLEIIQESSNRLTNTITAFMDMSLLASGNMESIMSEVSPENLILEVHKQYAALCTKKNLQLNLDLNPDNQLPSVLADEILIRKVYSHLMDNALKFTSRGNITLGAVQKQKEILFYVQDTGQGLSPDSKTEIFQYFVQENSGYNRAYEGSGLGLSISEGILKLMGGNIDYEAVHGGGTRFYFTLPVFQDAVIYPEQEENDITTLPGNDPKILVVEDDNVNFHFMSVLLTTNNIKWIRAKNGEEAVFLCRTHPEITLVLMDLRLPVLNGFEATRIIKSLRKNLPVIAVTAYSDTEDRNNAILAGCDEFIIKPINSKNLMERLKKYHTSF